jgi:hypothetical protein
MSYEFRKTTAQRIASHFIGGEGPLRRADIGERGRARMNSCRTQFLELRHQLGVASENRQRRPKTFR